MEAPQGTLPPPPLQQGNMEEPIGPFSAFWQSSLSACLLSRWHSLQLSAQGLLELGVQGP